MAAAETTPQKRVLPPRERRESAAKRRALSPQLATPVTRSTAIKSVSEEKSKRSYKKRSSIAHISTPTRNTPTSNADEYIPTRVTNALPLPTSHDRQIDGLSSKEYQSLADSAIISTSLNRSRMQWLCDGIFQKYWTKPVKKKGGIDAPLNNPDIKSMQKMGNATIMIEPHTFEAIFYSVREPQAQFKPPGLQAGLYNTITTGPNTSELSSTMPTAISNTPTAIPANTSTASPNNKTTDPVIQMLASRAATDNKLKDLMKVVATSRATPDQLKEFQAHIDEFNAIVKHQTEKEVKAKPKILPTIQNSSTTETPIKHITFEFISLASGSVSASPDRWLFPPNTILEYRYGGTELVCSFLVERQGSGLIPSQPNDEDTQPSSQKWAVNEEYYQPVTMTVKSSQRRLIETIHQTTKPATEVHQYMRDVIEKKKRAPQEYLIHRLPRDKPDLSKSDFIDSAVELSADDEDDVLQNNYPL